MLQYLKSIGSIRNVTRATTSEVTRQQFRMATQSASGHAQWPNFPLITELDNGFDLVLPGYSYGDTNRVGSVMPHKIPIYCERSRAVLYYPHLIGGVSTAGKWWRNMFKDFLPFVISSQYEVIPAFYDKRHLNNMLFTKDRIVNLTKSTYQHYQEFWSLETKELLHRSIVAVVLVNKSNRRAMPLPPEVTGHFKDMDTSLSTDLASRTTALVKPKAGSYVTSCQARWSDVDPNNHVNQSVFHRICEDGIDEACQEGYFTRLEWDVAEKFQVRRVQASFLAELNPSDQVDVHTWENEGDPLRIHSVISRRGQEVFHYTCQFAAVLPAAKY